MVTGVDFWTYAGHPRSPVVTNGIAGGGLAVVDQPIERGIGGKEIRDRISMRGCICAAIIRHLKPPR
jgi:hypothetical protein